MRDPTSANCAPVGLSARLSWMIMSAATSGTGGIDVPSVPRLTLEPMISSSTSGKYYIYAALAAAGYYAVNTINEKRALTLNLLKA